MQLAKCQWPLVKSQWSLAKVWGPQVVLIIIKKSQIAIDYGQKSISYGKESKIIAYDKESKIIG